MVLIFSEKFDPSTNDIIDWLVYLGEDFIRVNIDECRAISYEVLLSNDSEEIVLTIDERKINLNKIRSFWFRRGGLKRLDITNIPAKHFLTDNSVNEIIKSLKEEDYALRNFVYEFLDNSPIKVGSYKVGILNKLDVLRRAKKFKLKIPKTIVTGDKSQVADFVSENDSVISKAIHESVMFYEENHGYINYVEKVSDEVVNKMPDRFFPSKLQSEIDKDIELRIFYFNHTFYSMAIFSQLDEQTSVDFRVYNIDKPNRTVPYSLPVDIEQKLTLLMHDLSLETASIDMIKSKSGEYVFLEANPVGQFGMTSYPCNYDVEKIIANFLANGDRK